MNPKKKSRRCLGLGLNSGLDLAISRFIYSFDRGRDLPTKWETPLQRGRLVYAGRDSSTVGGDMSVEGEA